MIFSLAFFYGFFICAALVWIVLGFVLFCGWPK